MDSIKPSYGYLNSIPATEATYAWLIEQGARGLEVIGTKPMTDESSLSARAGGEIEEVDLCIVRTAVWRSAKFVNRSGTLYLKIEIWPHHRCSSPLNDYKRFSKVGSG
ncbi:hypothetical protein N7454_001470 [Penicillium verhagenii]|nr:hypothetical protein N7454_001470 [Penicillium verhagenii]